MTWSSMDEPLLGAFAKTWPRQTPALVAAEMRGVGLSAAQWNFSAIGLPTVSDAIAVPVYESVREAFEAAGVRVWGMSCTYNVTHPDVERRERLQKAAAVMIGRAPLAGAEVVSVCAGSHSVDGWSDHPDNGTPQAWSEMLRGLEALTMAAEEAGVVIAVEPEAGTIVKNAECGARLLDEMGRDSPLGFIIDSWNLVRGDTRDAPEVLEEAFELLGERTLALHAKDPLAKKFGGPLLDYTMIAGLQEQFASGVPVIIQDVLEDDMAEAMAFLRGAWAASHTRGAGALWS